ncbi:MAG: phage tail tape measure protein, partial [Alphaproteobacteria bacterium]|nr:phage tail tape measure protein [Alphaproteobacteria bacterium]
MTNALRGFNMEINEASAEKVADVYSKLAAMSASNVDEISTAMTKVASLASNANMEFETTAAFLAQIIETTRESAETAGTALKTVIARFSEVKKLYSEGELLGTDEEGEAIDVNKVSKALRTAGVNLNEYLTGAKGLDDIFIELASKWDNLDQVQQRYIATMAAGSRQQSRFIALMQDYGRTQELVAAAQNASGASQEQYEKTLESMETKLNRLKNAWNEFTMGIADNKLIKGAVDLLTGSLPGALNGIAKLALAFGAFKIGRNVFDKGLAHVGQVLKTGIKKTTDDVSSEVEKTSGGKIGASIKNGITKELQNFKEAGNPFKGIAKQISHTFDPQIAQRFGAAVQQGLLTAEQSISGFNKVGSLLDAGKIDEAAAAAQKYGVCIGDITNQLKELEQAKTQKAFENIGTSMIGTGSSIMILSNLLNRLGITSKKTTSILSTMGMTIMAAGLLMKLFGDSAMAAGVKTFIAGKLGESGWMWVTWIFTAIMAVVGLVIGLIANAET